MHRNSIGAPLPRPTTTASTGLAQSERDIVIAPLVAGLDVFDGEPRIAPNLLQCDNLVMLPHLGSATREAREAMGFRVLQNLDDFFQGRDPRDRVI